MRTIKMIRYIAYIFISFWLGANLAAHHIYYSSSEFWFITLPIYLAAAILLNTKSGKV